MKRILLIRCVILCIAIAGIVLLTFALNDKEKPAGKNKETSSEVSNKEKQTDNDTETAEDASRKKHSAVEDAQLPDKRSDRKNTDRCNQSVC